MSETQGHIGRYRIERELGRGGMGIVYLATDPGLGRQVALKLLHPEVMGDADRRARFKREAHALAALNHPNVATIHAFEDSGSQAFLVMEYVEGEGLSAAVRRRRLDQTTCLTWCEQIARGIAAAHDAGILHRDLKPANIRVRPDGVVKLLDFGLARSVPAANASAMPTAARPILHTSAGEVMGTPGYLAPEQARGEQVDRRADVFSFGCILYECLTGRTAFCGATQAELIASVLRDDPDWAAIPAEVPTGVRRLLERCLEKDPQLRIRDLADAALELRAAKQHVSAAPPTAKTPISSLPRELTSLVGREIELACISEFLRTSPVLTLTGSGGCGKTRLALRAASLALPEFPQGAWFVDLSAIHDDALVSSVAVRAVGVPATENADQPHDQRLASALSASRAILILDNAEHVLEGVRLLVQSLTQRCSNLRLLVTSREPLGLPYEQSYRVPSLSLPSGEPTPQSVAASESGRLFIERARRVDPSFSLSTAAAPALASICRQLDGIPLALELAAARTSSLSLPDIDARLSDALRVLSRGPRSGSARHATIQAAIQWGVQLLTPEERDLFVQLGVFAGGWTLAAAEAVCRLESCPDGAEVSEVLSRLVTRSLVQFSPATGRYRFLETVRQFALDQLTDIGIATGLRERHADYFLQLVERSALATPGASSPSLSVIDDDVENIHAALKNLEQLPPGNDRLGRLAFAMHKWWNVHGMFDVGLASLGAARARRGGALTTLDASLAAAAGNLEWARGRFDRARDLFQHALSIYEPLAEHARIAALLSNIAIANDRLSDLSAAAEFHQRAIQKYRENKDSVGLAFAQLNYSSSLIHEGRFQEAEEALASCLPELKRIGDRRRIGAAMHNLGESFARKGEHTRAIEALQESIESKRAVSNRNGLAHSYVWLGLCLAGCDRFAEAATSLGRGVRLAQEVSYCLDSDEQRRVEETRELLRHRLAGDFDRLWNLLPTGNP